MLSYKEALETLLSRTPKPRTAEVFPGHALGAVLAETVSADLDLPPFHKSFMDGYAVRCQDLDEGTGKLRVAGSIAAGEPELKELRPGEAWQIMTGAATPRGADAVQMVEKTRRLGEFVELLEPVTPDLNIAPRGSEVRAGDRVLEPGRLLGPAEIGVLASFGRTRVAIYRRPEVAIASTGDELVDADRKPGFGQIRNSNAHMLASQCASLGLDATVLPICPDQPDSIRRLVTGGLEGRDLLILSGGVSMGEHDYVHRVIAEEGMEVFFHKAAIKPGKPLIVARQGEKMIFGLPGNPVSSFVTFEVFVRPTLRKWMGFTELALPVLEAELMEPVRHKPGRLFFKPARTEIVQGRLRVSPVETKGSADIVAFSRCDALMLLPADRAEMAAGRCVEVMLLEHRQRVSGTLPSQHTAEAGR